MGNPAAQIKQPGALRAVKFVRGETAPRPHFARSRRDLAKRLHHVAVQEHAAFAANRAAISSIGWSTPVSLFAVMIETSVVSGRMAALNCSGSIEPVARNFEPRDLEPFPFPQMLERVQDGVMFGAGC